MLLQKSIFNSEKNNRNKLWRHNLQLKTCDHGLNSALIGHTEKPKTRILLRKKFFIIDHYLCYKPYNEDSQPWVCLNLLWTKAEFCKTQDSEFAKEFEFTLCLARDMKLSKIYLKGQDEKKVWRDALRRICTMVDFHDRYVGVRKIGEGSYAKVRLLRYFCLKNLLKFFSSS